MEDFEEEMTEEKALLILERTRYLEDSDCDPPEDFWSDTDEEQPVCHQKKHEEKAEETCPTDAPFETNPAVPRVEACPSTSAACSVDRTPACNNTVSTYPQVSESFKYINEEPGKFSLCRLYFKFTTFQEGCGASMEEEPEIESPLSMNQAHFLVKEESVDSNESWVDRIKQEPTSPLSMNTPKKKPGDIEDHDMDVKEECGTTVKEEPEIESHLSMNEDHFLVKEESLDSNDSWVDRIKQEPTSPLSMNTPKEEPDEIVDHVKEFVRESSQCHHIDHSAWNCSSQMVSSSTQSLSDGITAMNCQNSFLKSSFSDHEILVPISLESEKLFAVVPSSTAGDTMKKEETADVYLSKGHVVQQMAGDRQEEHSFENECRSSPNHEETPYQRSTQLSDSLRRARCKRSFKCNHCEKIFKRKQNLIRHMRIHLGECPFKCFQCGKSFTQSSHLTTHLQIHSGDRPFKCSQCEKSFTQKCHLTRHLQIHSGDRPFKCSLCEKSFARSSDLTLHMFKHTGVRPFKCSECGKSFTQSCNLTAHLRIHTGDRPFKCTQCGQSFVQSIHLTQHIRKHTGVRPFKCHQCGKCFARSSTLTRHMQIHRDPPLKCS